VVQESVNNVRNARFYFFVVSEHWFATDIRRSRNQRSTKLLKQQRVQRAVRQERTYLRKPHCNVSCQVVVAVLSCQNDWSAGARQQFCLFGREVCVFAYNTKTVIAGQWEHHCQWLARSVFAPA